MNFYKQKKKLAENCGKIGLIFYRTVRWLDRCIDAHKRDNDQSIFPIVQGKFQG